MNDVHLSCKQAVQLIKNKLNNGKRFSLQLMVDETSQDYLRRKLEQSAASKKGNDMHNSNGKRKRGNHGR